MALVLLDRQSGKLLPALSRPKRVALGHEDDRIAAVLAPIHDGWFLVPLVEGAVDGAAVEYNGAPVAGPIRLARGDKLMLGRHDMKVETCTHAGEPPAGRPTASAARVTLRIRNMHAVSAEVVGSGVIGTAPSAAAVVPAATGLRPEHAVVAHVGERWHLFMLDRAGAARVGDPQLSCSIPLLSGESVWLSESVELTLRCEEIDPLDRAAGSSQAPATPPPDDNEPLAESSSSEQIVGSEETRTSLDSSSQIIPSVPVSRDNTVLYAAVKLCRRLQATHARVSPSPSSRVAPVSGRAFRSPLNLIEGTIREVQQFRTEVEAAPWEPNVLFALAGYLRQLGLSDNARWVLKELCRQNPTDAVVNESLGMLYLEQSADTSRDLLARIADLKKANKYLARTAQLRPHDRPLALLLSKAGADLALMQIQTQKGRTGQSTQLPD